MPTINTNTRRWRLTFSLALLVLGSLIYANGMNAPFLFDGIIHILNNSAIRDISNLSRVFASGYQETRPVFMLSLAICYHIAGTEVFVYHLVNLLLHLGATLVVYQLTICLRNDLYKLPQEHEPPLPREEKTLRYFPEITAAFFLVHPLHTESVTYINSRSGLLMTCFGLLSCWLLLRALDTTGPRRAMAYIGSILTLLLALGSKEPALLFPLMMLVYLWLFRQQTRPRWQDRLVPLLPHICCIGALPLVYMLVTNPHPANPYAALPLLHHVWTQLHTTGYFLGLSLLPLQQNFDYNFSVLGSPWHLSVLASFVVLLAASLWTWRRRRDLPLLGFGLLWFLVFFAPTNSLILKDFAAERYLYASLLGVCWLLGWGIARGITMLEGSAYQRASWGILALWLCWLGGLTMQRNGVLSEPIALWRHTVAQSPNKGRPHLNLAVLLLQKGETKAGYFYLKRSAKLNPDLPEVHANLGAFAENNGQYRRAAKHFLRAFQVRALTRYKRRAARAYRKAGITDARKGKRVAAIKMFREAVRLAPQEPAGHYYYAQALVQLKKHKAARRQLLLLLKLAPLHFRGEALLQQLGGRKARTVRPQPRKQAPAPTVSPKAAAKLLFVPMRRNKPAKITPAQALLRCKPARKLPTKPTKTTKPPPKTPDLRQVRCMIELRYKGVPKAKALALQLFQEAGWVAGLQPRQKMNGGWRGKLRLVPQLPTGRHRRHLQWLLLSIRDYRRFFGALQQRAKKPLRYRWQGLGVQFFRSVGRATPSAMALGWDLYYNVNGSLLRSARGTRETFFHELFHLNDAAVGQWSEKALKPLYDAILKRCTKRGKVNNRCLKPYAPHPTIIRRLGIYYAFHKEGGVMEYGAELAIRYYREQRAILLKQRKYKPFKCRTKENGLAWKRMADTFFGGADLTPKCRKPR